MDRIVGDVLNKYIVLSKQGLEKYKTDLTRTDLTFINWLTHLQEELLDATLYLEKLMSLEETQKASEALQATLAATLEETLSQQLQRQNTLSICHQRMWLRVLKNPTDPLSYQYTPEEIEVIKDAATAFLNGEPVGKSQRQN